MGKASGVLAALAAARHHRRSRAQAHGRPRSRRRDRLDGCADVGDCCPCGGFGLTALVLAVAGAGREDARDPHTAAPASVAGRAAARLVRSYQVNVSAGRPPVCPMTPSCSRYALTALSRHGAWRGGRLAVARLWRCSPRRAGDDAVPCYGSPRRSASSATT